ncbi:hypothetical protein [Waterburya agarophytonicola]|uniref:hypothetical protein n=1 Tax=Waterburya agarophytonicola TaxID=2886916 RepID=UPI001E56924C|nr:hypothetical protein [Waterburya agarophytonicola]
MTTLVLFVVAGDILLPQPYRSESQKLKTNINQFLVSLFPNKKTIDLESIIDVNPE